MDAYQQYLDKKGLQQIELFSSGGSSHMSDRFVERLTKKVEIKKTQLRCPADIYDEFALICEATNSSLNEGIVEAMKMIVEDSRSNEKLQEKIREIKKKKGESKGDLV